MDGSWRTKKYGRLSGQEIESCLSVFRDMWKERETWSDFGRDEDRRLGAIQKLIVVPNWSSLYQDNLTQLIAKIVVVSGVADDIVAAAGSENPATALLAVMEKIPDEAPEHPAAVPLAFALIGNLDAIARYSRTINDMLEACKEGDLEALFQALSVDSIISTMPFFQSALRLGQLSGDAEMAAAVFRAIKGPHKKRLYPELRWLEYLLRDQGAFDGSCSREDIYELVVSHLGLYDPTGSKKDPKAALFTLFRSWQKEAGIQNPHFGFSVSR